MKRILTLILGLGMLLFFGFASARAVETGEVGNAASKAVKEIRTKTASVKCTVIQKQVTRRVTNFENQKNKHLASYQKTRAIIVEKMNRLADKGYDVKQINEDLLAYDVLIKKFEEDFAVYIAQLTTVQAATCDKTETDFRSDLTKAREQLKVVHQDSVAIRTYWAKSIRPHFLALKAQKPITEETTTDTTTKTGEEE